MDIAASSRPFFAMPSPTPEEKISLQASNTVYTYHCLCSHLVLATTTALPSLPTRQHSLDKAHIMPLPPAPSPPTRSARASSHPKAMDHYGLLLATRQDRAAQIIASDNGFEKRYLHRCARCALPLGYHLDWQHFALDRAGRRDDCVFLLPGGLVKTADMIRARSASASAGSSSISSAPAAVAEGSTGKAAMV